jgi:Zn-dependent protease
VLQSHIKLGSVFGIKIGLHFSWVLIALLIVFSLSGRFQEEYPHLPPGYVFALGVGAAILFFTSLLLHELSHSVVARSQGIPVREITLFALGGVSQLEGEAASAKIEFQIAIAGPAASIGIGLLLVGIAQLLGGDAAGPVIAALSLIGYINFGLAAFNMLPGYPLDGGRVLRAVLWWRGGDLEKATQSAAKAGQAVGFTFILLGIAGFFSGSGLSGLWLAFIGWFLLQAAGASYLETGFKKALAGARVADVMTLGCPTIPRDLTVQELVDQELLRTGRRCYVVADDGHVAGLVTANEIAQVDRARWPHTAVEGVMKPLEGLRTIAPWDTLSSALDLMVRENVNQLPVVEEGRLEGMLSRADVLNYLQTLTEFKAR